MKNKLAKIEARLQTLVEGNARRLFPSRKQDEDLMTRLADVMREGLRSGQNGKLEAPNLYTIWVHPSKAQTLSQDSQLLDELCQALQEAAEEMEIQFPVKPVIRIGEDPGLETDQYHIQAQNSRENLPQTASLPLPLEQDQDHVPPNAFVIVNGMEIIPLVQPVINVGRRPDNQLVIDDPRVSRIHAQLRAYKSHYVIFDLASKGGTWVNGERVYKSVLFPGDVISLAGIPLVFGQEDRELSDTQTYDPASQDEAGKE